MTESFVLFPDPAPPEVAKYLDLTGYGWQAVDSSATCINVETDDGWTGAIISVVDNADGAWALCRELRKRDVPVQPLLVIVSGAQLHELDARNDLFDDFIIDPPHPRELAARLDHLLWQAGRGSRPELLEHGPLTLNIETYQATVSGRPLDLTYMEYELLRFLASHPGKVFGRDVLLNRVWGYEYYGGARTVDVHVRRLRAKLGEEHSSLIQTIRSVGYKLGQSRWSET